jgi:hydroxymethylglutaryl-CoA lyase
LIRMNSFQKSVDLIECPRDAMQGLKTFIPTAKKIEYINSLLKVGFHTIDFGSFVSPKAIPQMADTKEVIVNLDIQNTDTKLLAIVANVRGAEEAVTYDAINYLGFPFSISETFQQRNTKSSITDSLKTVEQIQRLCLESKKELVVYMSMAFGNPYGDEYRPDTLLQWTREIINHDIHIISLADTIGVARPDQITLALEVLINTNPQINFGVHLHSTAQNWKEKLKAAFDEGCLRFDGALKGIGGCPMANDELVGNMNTEWMIDYFLEKNVLPAIDINALKKSISIAEEIFSA